MVFSLAGESGAVYQVEDAPFHAPGGGRSRLHGCRDHAGRERVAKLYPGPVADPQAAGWIRAAAQRGAAVVTGAEAAGTVGETAESSINFPIDVLTDGHVVIGVVLPAIPPMFRHGDGRPRTFEQLCTPPANAPAAVRVGVVIRVAEILAVLEGAGLVHGEISEQNVLWRQDRPQAYLIDCDGLRPTGGAAPGLADPRWTAQHVSTPDEYSDRYGLAVLAARGLLPGQDAAAAAGNAGLDPRLRSLFERAFGDPYATDARPTAAQWRDALRGVFLSADGRDYRQDAVEALDRQGGPRYDTAAMPMGMPAGPPAGPGGGWPGGPPTPPPFGPVGPGAPYPPPKPSSSATPLIIAAAVIVPIVLLGLVGAAFLLLSSGGSGSKINVSTARPYAAPTSSDPIPDDTTSAPEPDPTTSFPEPDPTTSYAPPPQYWGAIAVAHDGSLGKSWDYGSRAAADRRAQNECPHSGCKVLVDFVNGCGAVAYNPRTNRYWGGSGATKAAAERDAISNAGGGHWITWVCTTRP